MKSILVLDDSPIVADGVESYVTENGGLLGEPTEVTCAKGLVDLMDILGKGEHFDVTLVDLGLSSADTGLAAVDLLSQHREAGGSVIIHTLTDDDTRLLLLYAIFHWYSDTVAGLIPKLAVTEGATKADRAQTYVGAIEEFLDGGAPTLDRAAPFRARRNDAFEAFVGTWTQFRNLSAMRDYSSFREAGAKVHGVSTGLLAKWGTDAVVDLALLLDQAASNQHITGVPVARITATTGSRRNNPGGQLHTFAKSQKLFLGDSKVQKHYDALDR